MRKINEPHYNCLEELKRFLNTPTLKYATLEDSAKAVAKYFNKLTPKTEADYDKFYKTCDDFIYSNAYWNNSRSCKMKIHIINKLLLQYKLKNILEIGIGIGTDSIALSYNPCFNISVMRSNNLPFKFFKYRLQKRNIKCIQIIKKIEQQYDCVMFFDVIEHLVDPFKFLEAILPHTNSIIFTQAFKVHDVESGGFPEHFDYDLKEIIAYIISNGFTKIKINIGVPPYFFMKI